jgi:hypothetical protein
MLFTRNEFAGDVLRQHEMIGDPHRFVAELIRQHHGFTPQGRMQPYEQHAEPHRRRARRVIHSVKPPSFFAFHPPAAHVPPSR